MAKKRVYAYVHILSVPILEMYKVEKGSEKKRRSQEGDRYINSNLEGTMSFKGNKEISISLYDEKTEASFRMLITPQKNKNNDILLSFCGKSCVINSFFSENKDSFFAFDNYEIFYNSGVIKDTCISVNMNETGGTVNIECSIFNEGIHTNYIYIDFEIYDVSRNPIS